MCNPVSCLLALNTVVFIFQYFGFIDHMVCENIENNYLWFDLSHFCLLLFENMEKMVLLVKKKERRKGASKRETRHCGDDVKSPAVCLLTLWHV